MSTYTLDTRNHVKKVFIKLEKKNKKQFLIIRNKISQILGNPHRFKSLHAPMKGLRRVHIDKSFVLVYSIDEKTKTVFIEDYDHHNNIYG